MDRNHALWKALLLLIPQSLPWLDSSPSSLGQFPCPCLKRCAQSTSPWPPQSGISPAIEWSYLGHEPLVYLSPFPGKIDMVPILLYGRQPFPDPPNPLVALTAGTAYPHLKCVVLRKPHTEEKTSTTPCPCSPLSPSLPCFVQPPNSICWIGLYYFMSWTDLHQCSVSDPFSRTWPASWWLSTPCWWQWCAACIPPLSLRGFLYSSGRHKEINL